MMQKKKNKNKNIIKNTLFAIKWHFKVAPGYTIWTIFRHIYYDIFLVFEYALLVPYIVGCIEGQRSFTDILKLLIPMLCLNTAYLMINTLIDSYVWPQAVAKIGREVRLKLYQKAIAMDISKYDNSEFYNDFVWAMQKAPSHITGTIDTFKVWVGKIASSVVAGAFVVSIDKASLLVVALVLVLTLVSQSVAIKKRMRREEEILPHTRKRDYIGRVYYLIDYVKDLKMSNMSEKLDNDFETSSDTIKKVAGKHAPGLIGADAAMSGVNNVIYTGAYLIYLFYRALVQNLFGLSGLLAVYNAANRLKNSLYVVTRKIPELQEHSMYIEKLRTFLETEPAIEGGKLDVPKAGDLCLEQVSFTYEGNSKPTLKNISMQIKKGEKIALVGFNGAGKSTLIKLILRLYDPDNGTISYAGENIKNYKLGDYHKQFGTLFQDFEIFAANVGSNISMDDVELDTNRADAALEKVGFIDRFKNMAQGYDTQLTKEFADDGTNLSGGEAQKLAMARVLYADPAVIILDEPSSALDPIAEYQLNKTVTELAGDVTVIIISHRLSTTRFMDKIYMLENGEIKEQGTHESLMEINGKYAEMFRLQAEKYR